METKKSLKEKIKYESNMKEHYREQSEMYKDMYDKYVDLFSKAVSQLTVKNMQIDHLVNVLEEIQVVGDDMAGAIADNAINRHNLDVMIDNKKQLDEETDE